MRLTGIRIPVKNEGNMVFPYLEGNAACRAGLPGTNVKLCVPLVQVQTNIRRRGHVKIRAVGSDALGHDYTSNAVKVWSRGFNRRTPYRGGGTCQHLLKRDLPRGTRYQTKARPPVVSGSRKQGMNASASQPQLLDRTELFRSPVTSAGRKSPRRFPADGRSGGTAVVQFPARHGWV